MEDIKYQIKDLIIALQSLDDKLKLSYVNCTECTSFSDERYYCNVFNQCVPAKIILTGCNRFNPEIPF